MAVKRISLRGISRNPSDRMSPDGGVAESLNMQLEDQESAPVIVAKEIVSDATLPTEGSVYPVFIHKVSGRVKYIYVVKKATESLWTPSESNPDGQEIVKLDEGESFIMSTIMATGNILLFSTTKGRGFAKYLPDSDRYEYLGAELPELRMQVSPTLYGGAGPLGDAICVRDELTEPENKLYKADFDYWNEQLGYNERDRDQEFSTIIHDFWEKIDKSLLDSIYFRYPVFVRFALRLVDGSYVHQTVPIFMNVGGERFLTASIAYTTPTASSSTTAGADRTRDNKYRTVVNITGSNKAYMIFSKLENASEIEKWKDIIQSVDMFISSPVLYPNLYSEVKAVEKIETPDGRGGKRVSVGLTFQDLTDSADERESLEKTLLDGSRLLYKIKSYAVDNLAELAEGIETRNDKDYSYGENLFENDVLQDDYRSNHSLSSERNFIVNERLLSIGVREKFSKGMPWIYSMRPTIVAQEDTKQKTYTFIYEIKDSDGTLHHVYSDPLNTTNLPFATYASGEKRVPQRVFPGSIVNGYESDLAQILFYPDARCTGVYILKGTLIPAKRTSESSRRRKAESVYVKMHAHPYLSCSYFIGDISKTISELEGFEVRDLPFEDNIGESYRDTYLFQSKVNNPFYFPVEGRKRMSSSIISVAGVATPLSEGQAGDFDLYVFTDRGIWAMRPNAEGAYIDINPTQVSRDVLVHPESLVCIDQAVVFVTDRGVLALSGNQISDLSPNMQGPTLVMDETIVEKIRNNYPGVDTMVEASLKDTESFMDFVRGGVSIAFDYAGSRLIFFNKDYHYQYVYMLKSTSWHKIVDPELGLTYHTVMNSFPDAYVAYLVKELVPIYETQRQLIVTSRVYPDELKVLRVQFADEFGERLGMDYYAAQGFLMGQDPIIVTPENITTLHEVVIFLNSHNVASDYYDVEIEQEEHGERDIPRIYDYSSFKSEAEDDEPVVSVICTRAMDLDAPDILKSVRDLRIRGNYDKSRHPIKYMLLGSRDGKTFYNTGTLLGKAWKLFKIVILAKLKPNERISWIDIDYETRFTNKLR